MPFQKGNKGGPGRGHKKDEKPKDHKPKGKFEDWEEIAQELKDIGKEKRDPQALYKAGRLKIAIDKSRREQEGGNPHVPDPEVRELMENIARAEQAAWDKGIDEVSGIAIIRAAGKTMNIDKIVEEVKKDPTYGVNAQSSIPKPDLGIEEWEMEDDNGPSN